MNYREAMNNFSQCGLGMILAAQDNTILDINEAGNKLLCAEQPLQGKRLEEAAPFLCAEPESLTFGNPAFNQYLLATPTPDLDGLPAGTNILVFRDATKDYKYMLLENIFNLLDTAITVWDSNCRLLTLNDAAAKLEAHIISDVIGKTSDSLYEARSNSILVVPEMTSQKKPLLNLRQDFITHSGKELQIVSNNYPIVKSGELLGSVSMMEDYSKLDEMNKRIIQLQRSLLNKEKTSVPQKSGALSARYQFNDIIYQGDAMRGVIHKCKQISQSDSPVMIYGETGTGKELFAQSIHNASSRANAPFLAVNCAAIPDTLLESILFGTEKGAYTDAEKREGLFEQADTGSLLLDELNSMNTALQSKLLRVLQEGTLLAGETSTKELSS
ncbi:MAG: sigma 54-interacting transcriptional regulator [Lachnospiraceae bacterium]